MGNEKEDFFSRHFTDCADDDLNYRGCESPKKLSFFCVSETHSGLFQEIIYCSTNLATNIRHKLLKSEIFVMLKSAGFRGSTEDYQS